MAKTNAEAPATANDAESNEGSEGGTKVIAEWKGNEASPRVEGVSVRHLSKKDVKDGWTVEISKDLQWGPHNYRVDITDEPAAFREALERDGSWKVTEE